VLARDLRLAPETRVGLHVERLVEDVHLGVFLLGERIESLFHPDVARGAGADAATRGAVLRAELGRRLEQVRPDRDLPLRFQVAARIVDRHLRHHSSRSAEYAFCACGDSSPDSNSEAEWPLSARSIPRSITRFANSALARSSRSMASRTARWSLPCIASRSDCMADSMSRRSSDVSRSPLFSICCSAALRILCASTRASISSRACTSSSACSMDASGMRSISSSVSPAEGLTVMLC